MCVWLSEFLHVYSNKLLCMNILVCLYVTWNFVQHKDKLHQWISCIECRKFKNWYNLSLEYCVILLKRLKSIAVWCANTASAVSHNITNTPSAVSHNITNTLSAVSHNITNNPSAVSHNITNNPSAVSHNITNTPSAVSHNITNTPSAVSHNITNTPSAVSHNITNTQSAVSHNITNLPPHKPMCFEQVQTLPHIHYTLGSW
jgi:hypothetical protein